MTYFIPSVSYFLFQLFFSPTVRCFPPPAREESGAVIDSTCKNILSPSKTLGSHLNLPLFLIIIVHSRSGATFLYAAWLKVFLISTHCD